MSAARDVVVELTTEELSAVQNALRNVQELYRQQIGISYGSAEDDAYWRQEIERARALEREIQNRWSLK